MKMSRSVMILLLAMVSTPLFSLDIYVNDVLWQSFNNEDLQSLQVEFSDGSETESENTAIPFIELLPLMNELDGIRITIPSGDIFLDETIEHLRTSYLRSYNREVWDLNMNNSVYHDPDRIELYGNFLEKQNYILWTEPGVYGVEEQIKVWSSLHRVNVEIKEISSIADELISRQMTGDLMPDFVLQFQSPSHPYQEEKTIAFILQSILTPVQGQDTDTLILPSGHKLHPDLFMSILASFSRRESPFEPEFRMGPEAIKQAGELYFQQLLHHRIVEQDDFFLDKTYKNNIFAFFPARAFRRHGGYSASLPRLPEMTEALSSRVYPLQLIVNNEDLPEGTLLDFLKLPGIQFNLLSASCRQIPERTEALLNRKLTDEEQSLYNEWKNGYILSEKNYSFRRTIENNLPDLFRSEGDLPR